MIILVFEAHLLVLVRSEPEYLEKALVRPLHMFLHSTASASIMDCACCAPRVSSCVERPVSTVAAVPEVLHHYLASSLGRGAGVVPVTSGRRHRIGTGEVGDDVIT
jgi:hypothetical protein